MADNPLETRVTMLETQLSEGEAERRVLRARVRQLEGSERQLEIIMPELERLRSVESVPARAQLYGRLAENSRRKPMAFLQEAANAIEDYFGCDGVGFYVKKAITNDALSKRLQKFYDAYRKVRGDSKHETPAAARIRLFAEALTRHSWNSGELRPDELRNLNPGEYMGDVGVWVPLLLHSKKKDKSTTPELYFRGAPGEQNFPAFNKEPIQMNANPWAIRRNMKSGIVRKRKVSEFNADVSKLFNREAESKGPEEDVFRQENNNDFRVWMERQIYATSITWTDEDDNELDEIIAKVVCYGFKGKDPLQVVAPAETSFRMDTIDKFVAPHLSSVLLTENFRQYRELANSTMSKKVAKVILNNSELLKPHKTYASIMFADIAGYTRFTEEHPEEVGDLLLDIWGEVDPVLLNDYDGAITMHAGDNVMAMFGEPFKRQDHALMAVKSALHVQDIIARYAKKTGHNLKMSIGVNTGEVLAGSFTSKSKVEYTCVGDVVNKAARLQTRAGEERDEFSDKGIEVLATISEQTRRDIPGLETELNSRELYLSERMNPAKIKKDTTPAYYLILRKK